MKNLKETKGITLVALVITIIILLILAGISISSLTGSGLFKKAEDAKYKTERTEIIEKVRIDIFEKQTENLGKFEENELIEILKKYGDVSSTKESILDETLTTKDKKYEIKVSEIWDKPFESNKISFSINCPEEKEKYGGSFEVDKGTTWAEFFNSNFEKDWNGWLYSISTEYILVVISEGGNGSVSISYLEDDKENAINKNEIIKNR